MIALPCVLYSMDLTVLNLAVPRLSADLKPTSAQLLWIVDIYGFLVAGSLITMGTLGDRIGRRRLLMIGAAAFGVASVIAALSTSARMLIATRALLGVAGATLAPSTLSLIRNMFLDPRQRTVAIGIWVTSYSVGAAIGPLLGGILLQRIAEDGLAWLPVLSMVAGLALGVAFVRRQLTLAHPLIDLRLFRSPAFSGSLVIYTLGTFVAFGAYVFIAQYLQLVLGLSPLAAGLWTVPSMMAFVVGSMLVPVIVRRVRPPYLIGAGLVLAAVGFGILTQVEGASGLVVIVVGSVIYSLGTSPVVILTTDLIIGSAPVERAGAASAISETSSELGGALGIAILGSVGTAVYRSVMADGVPRGVSSEVARVAKATLGGAVAMAAGLPAPLGAELRDSARAAFAQSFEMAAGICAAVAIAGAIVAVVMLRDVPARPEPEGDAQLQPEGAA